MKINAKKIFTIAAILIVMLLSIPMSNAKASTKDKSSSQVIPTQNSFDTYILGERTKIGAATAPSNEIPVIDKVEKDITPKTGDTSHITLIFTITALAGFSLIILKRYTSLLKKKNDE